MKSGENVVVVLRLCGSVFAVSCQGAALHIRLVVTARKPVRVPDQAAALKLLRQD